jgi:hypothetical protein
MKRRIRFKITKTESKTMYPHLVIRQELDAEGYIQAETMVSAHSSGQKAEHAINTMKRIFAPGVVLKNA